MRPGDVQAALRAQLETWAGGFEPDMRTARFWGPTLATSSAAILVFAACASFVPGVRDFFGLRPAVPLALLALRLVGFAVLFRFERDRGWSPTYFAVSAFSMGFLFQLVASSLVVSSDGPGAFVLAVVPVMGAGYYCMLLRATPRFPWPALVQASGMAAALALRPESPYLEIFAVAGPLAIGSGLLLGVLGDTMAAERARLSNHRRAIEAHSLEESTGEARRLSSSLLELLQNTHDASSAISAALLGADRLKHLLREPGAQAAPAVEAAVASLSDSLHRVGRILGAPEEGATPPRTDAAPVAPVLYATLAQLAQRFPTAQIGPPELSPNALSAEVVLKGGAQELEQLVAELVKNSCEGTGARRAHRVAVSADAEQDPGWILIRVADDGPGFPPHILAATPTAFVTTKRGGSGLGLYTAQRLVSASGGSLELDNPAAGGGLVTLRLRRAETAAKGASAGVREATERTGAQSPQAP